jgi:hypothetical protein
MSRDRGASAEGAESIRSETGLGIPQMFAGEIDVLPADGSKVGKQRVRNNLAVAAQLIERTTEIHNVPERDRGGDEREPARTILLRLGDSPAFTRLKRGGDFVGVEGPASRVLAPSARGCNPILRPLCDQAPLEMSNRAEDYGRPTRRRLSWHRFFPPG